MVGSSTVSQTPSTERIVLLGRGHRRPGGTLHRKQNIKTELHIFDITLNNMDGWDFAYKSLKTKDTLHRDSLLCSALYAKSFVLRSHTWLRLSDFVQGPSCAGLLILYSPGYRPGGAYRDEINSHPLHFFTPAWAFSQSIFVLVQVSPAVLVNFFACLEFKRRDPPKHCSALSFCRVVSEGSQWADRRCRRRRCFGTSS